MKPNPKILMIQSGSGQQPRIPGLRPVTAADLLRFHAKAKRPKAAETIVVIGDKYQRFRT